MEQLIKKASEIALQKIRNRNSIAISNFNICDAMTLILESIKEASKSEPIEKEDNILRSWEEYKEFSSTQHEKEERYYKCVNAFSSFTKGKIYKVGKQFDFPRCLTIKSDNDNILNIIEWTEYFVKYNNNCFIEVSKSEYIKQEYERVKKELFEEEPKKESLFHFDSNTYFEGDKAYWFCKSTYKSFSAVISKGLFTQEESRLENKDSSKIYPTEELCKSALNEWIWENHKVTGKWQDEIWKDFIKNGYCGTSWKKHFCQTIINQKNG